MGFFINGTNFGKNQSDSSVTINGVQVPQANILNWSSTQITLQVPAKATSGPVVVIVGTNPGQPSNSDQLFTVTGPFGCN
jgi:uncharacterized protein (TIGR03437 family)